MSTAPDLSLAAARLRAALADHLEDTMTATDTEQELARFEQGVQRDRKQRVVLATAASVVALGAAGALYLASQDERSSTVASPADGAGTMVLELTTASDMGEWPATEQTEVRQAVWTGTLSLATRAGDRSGEVRLVGSAGLVETSTGPKVHHGWGTVEAELDGSACVGSYGASFYREPREAGGALQLSCDDGAVIGATLVTEDIAPSDGSWRMTVDLEDVTLVRG